VAEPDSVRIELAFAGGQVVAVDIPPSRADELERALSDGRQDAFPLDAGDGRYVVVLRRVVYVKRHARESRVGFGI